MTVESFHDYNGLFRRLTFILFQAYYRQHNIISALVTALSRATGAITTDPPSIITQKEAKAES